VTIETLARCFDAVPSMGIGLLAADAPAPAPSFFNPLTMFLGASFFLFYFLVLAPEKRRKNEEEVQRKNVKKNDHIVTIGGIHGTVVSVNEGEDVITIKIDTNTRIKINRTAIGRVLADQPEAETKTDS
jgi:preprotein translocase subunit YajC